jgi:hypothetical protein
MLATTLVSQILLPAFVIEFKNTHSIDVKTDTRYKHTRTCDRTPLKK